VANLMYPEKQVKTENQDNLHPTGCWKTRTRPSGRAHGDAASAAYSSICEHWREPRKAEWRPQARFFNSLLNRLDKRPMFAVKFCCC